MPSEVTGRRMLVTGATGEIGRFLITHFAAAGWSVTGLDQRDPDEPLPADVVYAKCDLADAASATEVIDALALRDGPWEVVVNCAGLIANAPLIRMDDGVWVTHDFALWQRVIAGSLHTTFLTTALTVKHMAQGRVRGLVVNLSSVCANGNPGQVAYSAAKAGVEGMTRALGKELGPLGVRVVAIALGYFDTASMHASVSDARRAKVLASVPLKRLGAVAEVAGTIEFLINNSYATGTVIDINGGLVV
jgi:3-oxoacyl-[acyl-carrier protein] reductase